MHWSDVPSVGCVQPGQFADVLFFLSLVLKMVTDCRAVYHMNESILSFALMPLNMIGFVGKHT